jgi:MFS family permease
LLRRIVGTTAASNLFGTLVTTLDAILILRILGLGPVGLGVIFSVGSVGGLLGALATPWLTKRIGEGTAVSLSAMAFGVTIFAMPLAGTFPEVALPILIVGAFLESFLVLSYNITQVTMRQRLTPPRLLGRMNASIRFVVWGVLPIASLIAGVLGTAIGVLPTMWIGAGGALFAAAFVVFSPITRMKQLPSDQLADPRVEMEDVAHEVVREPSGETDREP